VPLRLRPPVQVLLHPHAQLSSSATTIAAIDREAGMAKADATIWHNPKCGTSRKVLDAIRTAGIEPEVIEYVKTPPSRTKLVALLKSMGMTPRALLRRKGTLFDELGLDNAQLGDDALIDAMLEHPILIERPIVETAKGARLCRPPEKLKEIL
jgi:arsenate reductase